MSLKALKESRQHWQRMLDWAYCHTSAFAHPSREEMQAAIGEYWFNTSCPLCAEHQHRQSFVDSEDCKKCELKSCSGGSAWLQVYEAKTWDAWCDAARDMLAAIDAAIVVASAPPPPKFRLDRKSVV